MAEIARIAERPESPAAGTPDPAVAPGDFAAVVARTASHAVRLAGAQAMVVYTEFGRTARLASKAPLAIPIVAFTTRESVRRRLTLLRDVVSFRIPPARTVEEMISAGDRVLVRTPGFRGATVVELSGAAPAEGATNTVRVRRLPVRR
jgi:pyruvate kinase